MVLSVTPCGAGDFVVLILFMNGIISTFQQERNLGVFCASLSGKIPVIVLITGKGKPPFPVRRKAASLS